MKNKKNAMKSAIRSYFSPIDQYLWAEHIAMNSPVMTDQYHSKKPVHFFLFSDVIYKSWYFYTI